MALRAAMSEMQLDRYQMTGSHQRQDTVHYTATKKGKDAYLSNMISQQKSGNPRKEGYMLVNAN